VADRLLDTHAWLWLLQGGNGRLGPATRARILAAAQDGALRLSAISPWEVGMLVAKQRLMVSLPCQDWVRQALQVPGLSVVPLTPEIAVESSFLPGEFHGDPADRIIVATARVTDAVIVTADRRILDYARDGNAAAESAAA
jgi:PIN domain nuclease of toxin-antitoxin system